MTCLFSGRCTQQSSCSHRIKLKKQRVKFCSICSWEYWKIAKSSQLFKYLFVSKLKHSWDRSSCQLTIQGYTIKYVLDDIKADVQSWQWWKNRMEETGEGLRKSITINSHLTGRTAWLQWSSKKRVPVSRQSILIPRRSLDQDFQLLG